ncbi:MAG: hypothetical protein HY901_32240, partial [Deltaproteobacteria bacterium]|nr:hypothetical protein [Deltaproteobacteria bacterium]
AGSPVVTFEQGNSVCETYQSCSGGAEVTLCSVDGPHGLYNNPDVDIAATAWQSLSRFSLPR